MKNKFLEAEEESLHIPKQHSWANTNNKRLRAVKDILEQIVVTVKGDEVFFNDTTSPYEAVVGVEPVVNKFPFAKQLILTLFIWNSLLVREVEKQQTYIYSFFNEGDVLEMCVLCLKTGKIVLHVDGNEMIQKMYMTDKNDLAGLRKYLVSVGKIKASDLLVYNTVK